MNKIQVLFLIGVTLGGMASGLNSMSIAASQVGVSEARIAARERADDLRAQKIEEENNRLEIASGDESSVDSSEVSE